MRDLQCHCSPRAPGSTDRDPVRGHRALPVGAGNVEERPGGWRHAAALRDRVEGVESRGVYRRYIADNGRGMDPDELVAFFSQIGESGKAVGTRWDNLGWGAKLNLMPWNPLGIYVVSWQDRTGR